MKRLEACCYGEGMKNACNVDTKKDINVKRVIHVKSVALFVLVSRLVLSYVDR